MPRGNSEKSPGKMSKSAPTSPKNQHDLAKSSTLPTSRLADKGAISASTSGRSHSGPAPTTSESVSASPKKSRGATLTSFLKKLSPKLRPNASKGREKTWYVVEIAQKEGDAERVTTDLTARDGPHEDEGFTVSSNVCGSDPIKERHPHSGSGALGRNDTKNSQKLSNPHKGVEIQSGEKQSLLKGNSKKHLPDSNGKTNSSQQASNQMVTKASTSQKEEIKEKV